MYCIKCKTNGVGRKRALLGHLICKPCGEREAQEQRKSWTVMQSYGKGNYQFVTPTTAMRDLRNTNQKETRGAL
jgi:hypothetical protein